MIVKSILLILALALFSCGQKRQYEDYKWESCDIKLTKEKHPHGWGQSDCYYCHVKENLHDGPAFDVCSNITVDLDKFTVSDCSSISCHGSNYDQ